MEELTLKEWCESRGIPWRLARQLSSQLRSQYSSISKYLAGRPIDRDSVERELIQLVCDTQTGRFPISQRAKADPPLV